MSESGSGQYEEEFRGRIVNVIYRPGCRLSGSDAAWPRRRFKYRPNGPGQDPVVGCRWCGKTFSGWPATLSHGLLGCLAFRLWGDSA